MGIWTRNYWQNAEAIDAGAANRSDGALGGLTAFHAASPALADTAMSNTDGVSHMSACLCPGCLAAKTQSDSISPSTSNSSDPSNHLAATNNGDGPQFLGDDIADNTSTTTSIAVGGTLNSSIQTSGDLDYISISLVAGHAYTFSLDFAGTGFSSDGYLELRDSTGVLVAQNDDGGNGLDSFMVYTATQTGTFYIVARGYDSLTTGAYTLTTDEIATGQTSPTTFVGNGLPYFSWEEAAIQISRTGDSWATALNTPAVVTYAYRASAPANMPDDTAGFSTFSAAQIAATEAALAAWASVANITFVRVNDGSGYSNNATILFGNYSSGADGAAAFAYLPGDPSAASVTGDVWVNISLSDNANLTPGGYGNQVLLHEIGHALGLSHPGDYNAGQGNPTYPGSSVFYGDTRMFTLMSYFSAVNTGGVYSSYASLPQVFDIAAIQRLYGANTSTRTGDTIYGFNSNTGIAQFTLTSSASQAIFTIWDGGGNDTLDLSLYTTSSLIDLREESFSTAGPRTGGTQLAAYNISIAHGVIIENAIGGSGDDTIIGNDANNVLDGRAGFDIMRGGLGNDTYYGNNQDTIIEEANAGTDTFVSSSNATLGDNVENLILDGVSANTGTGNILSNVITGNSNANTLSGLGGNDRLVGGVGNDTLLGGTGIDTSGYSIAATSSSWHRNPDGTWTVTAGTDGTDTLTSVEYLDFTDRDVFLDRPQSNFSTDGVSDFFLRNTATGSMVMWFNANSATSAGMGTLSTDWVGQGFGDFDGDGRDDILWRNSNNGNMSLWFMNNQAVTGSGGYGVALNWSISGIGDINGDLRDDIVLRNSNGDLVLWFMDGLAITGAGLGNVAPVWQIEVLGDFNGDGRDDFIWRNSSTGAMSMWLMNGTAAAPDNFANVGGAWNIAGVGDLNGDGRDDVMWRNGSTGDVSLWFMNSGTITSASGFNVATNYEVADIGDYNGDGRDDIIWHNTTTGDVIAWYMNGAAVTGSAFLGGLNTDWIINPGG